MTVSESLGSLGVGLLLIAFFLISTGRLARQSAAYQLLNLVGATLACIASWMIGFLPFVVLEGAWALVAAAALARTGERVE